MTTMIKIDPEGFYTVPDIAEALGLIDEVIRRKIRSGAFPAVKRGRKYVVKGESLIKYLEGKEVPRPCELILNGDNIILKAHDKSGNPVEVILPEGVVNQLREKAVI